MKASSVWRAANVVLSTSAASHRLVATQPRATGIAPLPEHGHSLPQLTPPPRPDDSHQDLVKRTAALETPITMMIVPDNTCGWLSARIDAPYTCARGDTCGLILAQPTGAVMCYNVNDETSDFALSCIDYSSYFSSSACGYACDQNTYIRKWYVQEKRNPGSPLLNLITKLLPSNIARIAVFPIAAPTIFSAASQTTGATPSASLLKLF